MLAALAWYLAWRQAGVVSLQRQTIEDLRHYIGQLEERASIVGHLEAKAALLPPGDRKQLAYLIHRESRRYALDWRLLAAIIEVESNFASGAQSKEGALGLMQLLPSTAAEVATALSLPYRGPADLLDMRVNLQLGTGYLHILRRRFGTLDLALQAYNVGPTRLSAVRPQAGFASRASAGERAGSRYVAAVLARYTPVPPPPAPRGRREEGP